MKKNFLIVALIAISGPLMGQNSNQLNDMIVESLRSYSDYESELHKEMWGDYGSYNKYVYKDGLPRGFSYDSLPNLIFFSANYIKDCPNPLKKDLKKRKGASGYTVSYELKNNRIQISVTSRTFKLLDKKTIGIFKGDGGQYFYEYSCETQQWELKEVDLGQKKVPNITPKITPETTME